MRKTGLGSLLFVMGVMSAALAGAQTAQIRELRGTVEVKQPGTSAWETAAAGQVLEAATLISTGFKSAALLSIGNSSITVRALTSLSLEEIVAAQEQEQVTLNLRAGRIRANVKPPVGGQTSFTVRSPTATASVRGTIFDFDGVRLRVEEGRVYLAAPNAAGSYISGGHSAAAEEGTGKVAGAIETIREELSPALPAGVDTVPAGILPGPASANLDIWFDWSDE
ncbi:MAG: FecR family protein [Treponema sp.]|jgi:hypothetical protein|nr:FecR family protein [Treponema sp.]